MCLAAQFQNIFLHNEKELLIDSNDQLGHFVGDDKKRISHHPLMAAELLQKNPNFDSDVLIIIKEQHGDKRGIGFPEM